MTDLVDSYLCHLRAGGYSTNTVDDRRKLLRRLDHDLPLGLDQAATEEIETWLAQFGTGHPSWTVCTYFTGIRAFYRWAVRAGLLTWDPTESMAQPRTPDADPHPWTEEQFGLALTLPWPLRLAAGLAGFQGLRCAEIARLDREHVDGQRLRIRRKGGRVQELPTHTWVWAEVLELPPGPVIRTCRGCRYRPGGLSTAMSTALTHIGLPDLTLHGGRHRFATMMLRPEELGGAGMDIRTVQDLMGHRSLNSTMIYTAITNRQRQLAIAALPVPASPQKDAA